MENLINDLFLSFILLLAFGTGAFFVTRRLGVSRLPLVVITPILIGVGLLLYLPASPLFVPSDGMYYQSWGFGISESWASGSGYDGETLVPGKGFWPLIIASFHYLFGPVTAALIVFNALCVVAAVISLQKATLLISGLNPRWSIIFLTITSSPTLLFGPSLLREAIFWLGCSLGVVSIAYAHRRLFLSGALSLIASVGILIAVRADAGVVISYGLLAVFVLIVGLPSQRRTVARWSVTSFVLLALVASAPSVIELVTPRVSGGAEVVGDWRDGLSQDYVTTRIVATTTWCQDSGNTPLDRFWASSFVAAAVCEGFGSLPAVLVGPFWWEIGSESIWLIVIASTGHFLLLVGLSVAYLAQRDRRNLASLGLVLMAFASLLMFASIMTNYGILIRFRAASEIFIMPLATATLVHLSNRLISRKSRVIGESSEP